MNNSWYRIREHVSIIKILSRNRNIFRYHGPFSFAFYKYWKFYTALHVERGAAEATEVWPSSQPTVLLKNMVDFDRRVDLVKLRFN